MEPIQRASWRILGTLLTLLFWSHGTDGSAQTFRFADTRLTNGLRVVISEDHTAPVASVSLVYNAGSRDERPGHTGLAHLFEHLMFAGSANVSAGEHRRLINQVGGRSNASASPGRTLFTATVPANQLELVLFLEADRMRSLDISLERLETEKKVVAEERRMRLDNQQWGRTFEVGSELAYQGFTYGHPGMGTPEDLARTTLDDARDFFNRYYAPNNAVLAVVGDVDVRQTIALVRKYFSDIPGRTPPERPDTTEHTQTTERRRVLSDPLASLSRIDILWHIPPVTSADREALDVLAAILGEGRASRLYEALITETPLASRVFAGAGESRDTGLFSMMLIFPPSTEAKEVEAVTYQAVERLQREPAQAWELQKAKKQVLLFWVQQRLRTSESRATLLAETAMIHGDPAAVNRRLGNIASVTAEDVTRVAKRYLQPSGRNVIVTLPKSPRAPQPVEGRTQ